jgi:tetratricopeptide (TPR) repeat protein
MRDFAAALHSYEQTLKLKSDLPQAWNNRGNCLFELNRLDNALFCYEQAIELNPEEKEAWFNRGRTLSQLGRIPEALACYEQARHWTKKAW